jgi:hydrogenase-1 operon protein HyaF
MSRLTDIPIRIEPLVSSSSGGLGGGVTAILTEIVRLLERLASLDEPAAIDLRSLPMSPQDRTELQNALGEGEVQATLNAEGISRIHETRVPGVWWVEHRDRHGEPIAELIEVSRVPQILASASEEIAAGARDLRERITAAMAARSR